ncbi:hypothetical protein MUK42_16733 [Musa troglodytarum]|uniref:Uncharacterized protein n=1 Tax=Musa troglodytarum TaxID=320322 RepID=A0A9E7K2S4_9LILI|nr:hypothetical protein MUK42_16733 [Musa troglodytarum]
MSRQPRKTTSAKTIVTASSGFRLGHLLRCCWWHPSADGCSPVPPVEEESHRPMLRRLPHSIAVGIGLPHLPPNTAKDADFC